MLDPLEAEVIRHQGQQIVHVLRPLQSGFTGNYAAAIMVGAIIILGYVLIGGGR